MEKRVDITISLTETQHELYMKLMQDCGMSEPKELFNAAVSTFYWLKKEVDSGYDVASYDKNKNNVVVLDIAYLHKNE